MRPVQPIAKELDRRQALAKLRYRLRTTHIGRGKAHVDAAGRCSSGSLPRRGGSRPACGEGQAVCSGGAGTLTGTKRDRNIRGGLAQPMLTGVTRPVAGSIFSIWLRCIARTPAVVERDFLSP